MSDLSRTVTDSLRLDVEPWDFPRVDWPDDWRLPHLRGFDDWGDRQRQRGRNLRRHRIWRSGTDDGGAREEGDQRRRLERKLTRAERDNQHRTTSSAALPSRPVGRYQDSDEDLGKSVGVDPLDNLQRYVRKARIDLHGFGWAPPPRKGARPTWDRAVQDEEEETRRKRDEAFEVLQRSRRDREHRLRLRLVSRAHTAHWTNAVKACESTKLCFAR